MYEENQQPLPPGDALHAFAPIFRDIRSTCELSPPAPTSHQQVLFWAKRDLQNYVARISRRLLLPGSVFRGIEKLEHLIKLSTGGASCILCLNHRSNLDVPTMCAMLQDYSESPLFEKIIWIAGRKLQEDQGLTGILLQGFNRVIVTPRSWSQTAHSPAEIQEAHLINIAAHRVIHDLRDKGRVFALFPTGTRIRPGDTSTTRAVPETDSYLKSFEYMMLANIQGCTLPVSRDQDLTRETPRLDRVIFSFGEVLETEKWRATAARRFPGSGQRTATARAIMQDIDTLGNEQVKNRRHPAKPSKSSGNAWQ